MVSDSRRLSGGVSRETHETREKRSASRLSPTDAPQVPGSPDGPVHAGEDAGRAADGGVPRARRPKGNLSSRRWRGTRSCEAWWLHRPNQVPFVSFVCFAGNGFRQVNCIIPKFLTGRRSTTTGFLSTPLSVPVHPFRHLIRKPGRGGTRTTK